MTSPNDLRMDSLYIQQDQEDGSFYVVDNRSTSGLHLYSSTYTQCLIFVGARALGHDYKFAKNCADNAAKYLECKR